MKNYKVHLQYTAVCQRENRIWFVDAGINSLFSLNLDSIVLEYKCKIPFLNADCQGPYGNVCCSCESKILFFPANCRQILLYDVENHAIEEVLISALDQSEIYTTHGILHCKEQIWIFPQKVAQGIFVLDLQTLQLETDWKLNNVLGERKYIYKTARLNESRIMLLTENSTLMEIDVLEKCIVRCKQFVEIKTIWSFDYDGNNFWLLPSETTNIYEWNPKTDELFEYQLTDAEWITKVGLPFSNVICWDKQIFILPSRLKYIMKVDREKHIIQKAFDYPDGFRFMKTPLGLDGVSAFYSYSIYNNKIIIHPILGNMLLIYDVERNCIEGKEMVVSGGDVPYLNLICEQGLQRNGRWREAEDFGTIEAYLNMLKNKKSNASQSNDRKSIGKEIYGAMDI